MQKMLKNSFLICLCLVVLLTGFMVGASEDENDISLLQTSYADENSAVQLFAQHVDANLAWDISFDKTSINVGDVVTATVAIKNNGTDAFNDGGGIQFDINYDDNMFETLILDNIFICPDISSVQKKENSNGLLSVLRFGSSFSIPAGSSVDVAKISFTAKNNLVETDASKVTAEKLYLTRTKLTSYDAETLYLDSALIEAENSIDIYDIKVNFLPGDFGTIAGQTVAYARYNEEGLYADSTYDNAFALPVITADARQDSDTCGYRVSDTGWLYNSTDKFTQNSEFTAQYTKTQNIKFFNSNGTGNEILVVTDYGADVEEPATAENFAGWFAASIGNFTGKLSDLVGNVPTATADMAYKAYFYADSDFLVDDTFASVAAQNGVDANEKVTGDIEFTVAAPLWATIKSVKAFCGENEVSIAYDNNIYTVLNSHLNGDVTVKVVTEVNGTVDITEKESYSVYTFTSAYSNAATGYYKVGNLSFAKRSDGKYLAIDEAKTYTTSVALLEKMNFSTGNEIIISEAGDLDASGGTDIRDVQEIFTYYTDGVTLETDVEKTKKWFAADLNNDCKIDITDAQLAVIEMLR